MDNLEEITTIFVVGFPEDMKEREFQNMFTFSSGFEAATLKLPTSEDYDKEAANNAKKQIIGFAKFRSRLEALEARDILTGRKVDAEFNSVLKAEMAKKNLHTKRGLVSMNNSTSNSEISSAFPFSSRGFGGLGPSALGTSRNLKLNINTSRHFDRFSEAPLLSAPLIRNSDSLRDSIGTFDTPVDNYTSYESSIDNILDMDSSSTLGASKLGSFRLFKTGSDRKSALSDLHGSQRQLDLAPLRTRLGSLNINSNGPQSALEYGRGINSPITPLTSLGSAIPPAPGLTIQMATTRSINSNDQNPPCNTLYVGNLPASTKEDELRALFQTALGYKRMIFRTKPNSGPMCFVEFRDVSCATNSLRELDGRLLTSSVNGGIRLSYSKNPLGVRSNGSNISQNFNSSISDINKDLDDLNEINFDENNSLNSNDSSSFVSTLVSQNEGHGPFPVSSTRDMNGSLSQFGSSGLGLQSILSNSINSNINFTSGSIPSSLRTSPLSSENSSTLSQGISQTHF
ncbi:Cell wall integrity protein scw1 [Smittium culicis]|uniref:Cell wall integrity protein scw1 n=1 Tax=Smittium culicis TaxID=133412 RepID=A0A1R1XUH8_9FUNG|nr:Cell wall integrity protein scw1 [Smittium culicis]OMJ26675.1 Cell wall integrity protein scw1 [Smittium culicis]